LSGKVYALGYGRWKDAKDFVELLKGLKVDVLVDVRWFPRSKNPQFAMENLRAELSRHGIRYESLAESLGGFRRGGYEKYMETSEYEDGIRKLLQMSESCNAALMCLEPKSKHCHRRFIMQTLVDLGAEVIPIE